MSWQHWVLVAWMLAELLYAAGRVGKTRPPITASDYAFTLFTFAVWAVLAVTG